MGRSSWRLAVAISWAVLVATLRKSVNCDGRLVIKYRRKGDKFVGREVEDPAAFEALEDDLLAAKRHDVLGSERPFIMRPGVNGRDPVLRHNHPMRFKRAACGPMRRGGYRRINHFYNRPKRL